MAHRPWPVPLALALAAGLACRGAKGEAQGPPAMAVKIEVAQSVSVDDTTDYVATLKSRQSAAIMPQVEGQITKVLVRAGDRVAAGTPLMQIDPAKQQATVRSQEDTRAARLASVAFAKQQYDRVSGLAAAGVMSRQDLDQAKAALDAAEAELHALDAQVREQEVQLRYYQVAAPTSGMVGDIPVRVGDRVTVSTLLTTVDSAGGLEVYVSVPVERAAQLKLGVPVRILDSSGAAVAESRLSFISPQVDNQTQTVLVKARIEDRPSQGDPSGSPKTSLRPAQFIRARVVWGTRQGPVVPLLAVSRISGQYFAFVAEAGPGGALVARQKALKVGEIVGNGYFVQEGIKPGDRVIVSGTQFLRDGAPVTPQG